MTANEKNESCDFCGSTELEGAKTYACEHFTLDNVEYVEGWDACTKCAALIDRNDWDAVYQRAVADLHAKLPKGIPDQAKRFGENQVRKIHAEFRRRRLKSN